MAERGATDASTASLARARALDTADGIDERRAAFHMPSAAGGEAVYLCGNSLGPQPRSVGSAMDRELEAWAGLGVEGHFKDDAPWYSYHEPLREPMARIVGALPREVVLMNSLTVNLHLLMASFYRPTAERHAILLDGPAFPSDAHAVASQTRWHGHDPARSVRWMRPEEGENVLPLERVASRLERDGDEIALVLLSGVSYFTGQWHDIGEIARLAHARGCVFGVDLAHAAGNVPLRLHDWNVDFAAWCTYKYLNAGPGAVAGAFVHKRHLERADFRTMPRLEGWWGTDPATRFRFNPDFVPVASADAWQLSNPPILAMVPLRESLAIFDRVGMDALRERSIRLTGFLERVLDERLGERVEVVTPRDPDARGAQISIRIPGSAKLVQQRLLEAGVIVDFREPDVLRVAPAPLYSTCEECWRFVDALAPILVS